jgi:hypothetical protein
VAVRVPVRDLRRGQASRATKLRAGRSLSCGAGHNGRPLPIETCEVPDCESRAWAGKRYCPAHQKRADLYDGDPLSYRGMHGMSDSPTYRTWAGMIARCSYPGNANWSRYGGAEPPVRVCDRWLGEIRPGRTNRSGGFAAFLEDMGPRPGPGFQLHRVDDALTYGPAACRWLSAEDHRRVHRGTPHG